MFTASLNFNSMETFFIISFVLLSFTVNAQIVNIPYPNFEEALLNHNAFGGVIFDTIGDGEIQVSEAEAITELVVGDPWASYNIQHLTGIEAFVNITFLNCQNNQLTSIDLSENRLLEKLYCYDNSFVSIDVTQNVQLTNGSYNYGNIGIGEEKTNADAFTLVLI